uniref:BED-type domain-containing protein n=1 Tax=Caenorhabditis japonica TaxID=281687 RepID=A0A8R1DSZ8_CAEJA
MFPPPPPKPRIRNIKNPSWKLFHIISNDHAQCSICLATIATTGGNTSGINRHAQRFHAAELAELDDRIINDESLNFESTFAPRQRKNSPARLLALSLATSGAPMSLLRNVYFKTFLKQVGNLTISVENLKNEIEQMTETSKNTSKMTFNGLEFVGCRHLRSSETTPDRIAEELLNAIRSVGVDKWQISKVITDRDSDISKFNYWTKTPCLCRILARFMRDVMTSESLNSILEKARKVSTLLSKDLNLREKCAQTALAMGFKSLESSSNRWGQSYLLVKAYFLNSVETIKNIPEYGPTDEEIIIGTECVELLDEVYSLLIEFEKDESTSSSIIPNLLAIYDHLDQHNYHGTQLGEFFRAELKNRTGHLIENIELQLSCFADPRFAFFDGALGATTWENVENVLIDRYDTPGTAFIPNSPESEPEVPAKKRKISPLQSFMSQRVKSEEVKSPLKTEVMNYRCFIQLGERPTSNSDPLQFWNLNESKFPTLSKICKDLLAVPSSSAATERLFVSSGNLACNLECRVMPPEVMNAILFVNGASRLVKPNSKIFAFAEDEELQETREKATRCEVQQQSNENKVMLKEEGEDEEEEEVYDGAGAGPEVKQEIVDF